MASYQWKTSAFNGGAWTNAADWTPRGVPGASDDVTFQITAVDYTITGDDTVHSITVNGDGVIFAGNVNASGGGTLAGLTATNSASVTIGATAAFTTSALAFAAGTQLIVNGLFIDSGISAGLGGAADVLSVSGADANFIAAAAVTLNTLQIDTGATYAGDVALTDGGNITLDTSATFGGGTLTLAGNATLYVANAGTDNAGSLGLQKSIVLSGAGDGLTLADDPGVTLTLSGGIAGAGYVDVNSGIVALASPSTYTGGTIVDGATLSLTGAGAAGTGAVFLNNALLTVAADSTGAAGSETVVGNGGADTIQAAAGNLLLFAGNAASLAVQAGAGSTTVIGGTGDADSIQAGAGNLLVFAAGAASLSVQGGAGAATVIGGTGDVETIQGGAGSLLVFGGGRASLSVQSGAGAATVVGGSGVLNAATGAAGGTLVAGSSGADTLTAGAGAGATTLIAAAGGHLAVANAAADTLAAAGGNTTLQGGTATAGNVFFASGTGTTVIETGSGVDTVVANGAAQQIFAGTGTQDVFLSGGMSQIDFIDGFAGGTMNIVGFAATDTLHVANYGPGAAQAAVSSSVEAGGNTFITLSDNTHIVLFGFTGLTGASFV